MPQGSPAKDKPAGPVWRLGARPTLACSGDIAPTFQHIPRLFSDVLDVITASGGVLNFNDGLLVVLQRDAVIDDVASFDDGFDVIPDFRRID